MKAKFIMIVVLLTAMIGQFTFAEVTNEFILIGGDEYISVEAIKDLDVEVTIEDGKVLVGDTLAFDIEKDCIKEDEKIFVPFKETLESVNITFNYTEDKKMKVDKDNTIYNIDVKAKEHVKYEKYENFNHSKMDLEKKMELEKKFAEKDKKQNDDKIENKKPVPQGPKFDMKYLAIEGENFINMDSLKLLYIDVQEVDGDFLFKNIKNDKTIKLTIKDVNFGYELDNIITRIPAKEVLEALDIDFEVAEGKLVIDLDGQIVVFHD